MKKKKSQSGVSQAYVDELDDAELDKLLGLTSESETDNEKEMSDDLEEDEDLTETGDDESDDETDEDETSETDEDDEEESDEDSIDDEDKSTESPNFADIEVKINHKVKKLGEYTPEEIRDLVQKGSVYEKRERELSELKANPKLGLIDSVEELASLYDVPVEDFLTNIRKGIYSTIAEERGISEEDVEKLIKADSIVKKNAKSEAEKQMAEQESVNQEAKERKMLTDFIATFSKEDLDKVSDATWEKVQAGQDLSIAYEKQLLADEKAAIDKIKKENEILKKQQSVKSRSPIKSSTKGGSGKTKISEAEEDEMINKIMGL